MADATRGYRTMPGGTVGRRDFLKTVGVASAVAAGGILLGSPPAYAEEPKPPEVETNLSEYLKVPRGPHAIPGPFPGRVAVVKSVKAFREGRVNPGEVNAMFAKGLKALTGASPKRAFDLFFEKGDTVGIKVNPVGAPLIHTTPELALAVVAWLERGGIPRERIVIWDRFADMLKEAGFTPARFPGLRIEALQVTPAEGAPWKGADGRHLDADRFDPKASYFAKGVVGSGVKGYGDDDAYLGQHVFAGERSYFGRLVTEGVTKIINLASFKNTGHGVSMATKNLGYGAICNTGRLHAPLFFRVCTEVLAAPWVRDRLVLNVLDGLRGQYDQGPMANEAFVFPHNTLYFATDPFALDMHGHLVLLAKRKEMGIKVSEHPRYTDYLRQAEALGLGVVDGAKMSVVEA